MTQKELLYKKLGALRLEVDSSIVDSIVETANAAFKEQFEAMGEKPDSPTDEEITEKAIQYSKQFEIRDKPIESEINRSRAVRDYYAGYKDAIQSTNKEVVAMSINSENVYTKNPCDENVNMSDITDDAQSNVADNQEAIEPKGECPDAQEGHS